MGIDSKAGYYKPKTLQEALEALNLDIGATVHELEKTEALEREGITAIRLDVQDMQTWETELAAEALLPHLGEIAWQAYTPKDEQRTFDINDVGMHEEALYSIFEADISFSNRVYIISHNEKAVGFLAMNREDDSRECSINLVVTHPDFRGKNLGKELLRYVFSSGEYDVVAGASSTPAMVKTRLEVGKECGYTGYYCGFKEGEFGVRGTPEEQKRVSETSDRITKEFVDAGNTIDPKNIPENYIVMQEDMGIPPIRPQDIQFAESDTTLDKTFREALLPMQQKFGKQTVYGILLNIRE